MEEIQIDNLPVVNDKKNNGLKIATAISCIVAVCGIGFGVFGMMQSLQKDDQISDLKIQLANNNNEDEDVVVDNSINLDFDFNALSKSLKSSTKNNDMVPIMAKCYSMQNAEGELPNIEYNYTVLSENTIENVIKKLKSASSIDKNITYSWVGSCPPKLITYHVGVYNSLDKKIGQKIFSLDYAIGDKILLVTYDGTGYAFNFSDSNEIEGFIESLASTKK